ncbi:hypothetical protein [Mycobacterium haemophilum]|uniref:Membrane protein n=1 Tax=Mycobacterium haemophilum TaxID=29311 RepID=A0A0I9YDR0_9MYCO|nr:hypothetical protein [Mycobacterium haemophilum]KLO33087.1 membrane protein [Mycobacterium haemophilum]KLO38042.1 membrane protein [Mycobacterium haemophilum]KLO44364.1 membrane protein [Mycobacterium haemophilum]KLO55269.1 membrane protein [Mycobacterium haemophilum]
MIGRYRGVIELGLAFLIFVGAEVSWLRSRYTVPVAPVADGQPITMSVVYDPQQLLLTLLLGTLAGILAVVGATRLLRARMLSKREVKS